MATSEPTRWTFSDFSIDMESRSLSKSGQTVRIGPQAFRALALLVSRAGALVTRDELQKAIWGDEVHVDFDQGLYVCVRQIRAALGDGAEGSRLVLTCPREGYRLAVPATPLMDPKAAIETPVTRLAILRWPFWQPLGATAAFVTFIAAAYLLAPSALGDEATSSSSVGIDSAAAVRPKAEGLTYTSSPGPRASAVFFSSKWSTRNVDAVEWYWRGRGFNDRSTGGKPFPFGAIPHFERAVALDPGFARAHATLALAYLDQSAAGIASDESIVRARSLTQRALALDADSPEAHVALAEFAYRLNHDAVKAQAEFMRALELDLNGQGLLLRQRFAVFLQEQRRYDEALRQLDVALDIDPFSIVSNREKARTLYLANRCGETIVAAKRVLEIEPAHAWSFRTIGKCLEILNRPDEAVQAYMKAGRPALGQLGSLYAKLGQYSDARGVLSGLTAQPFESPDPDAVPVAVALIYTALREPEKAMEVLEMAHQNGLRLPVSLRVTPEWGPLRAASGFSEFLKRADVPGI